MKNDSKLIARWKTRGHDFLELYRYEDGGFSYTGNGCGGLLPFGLVETTAIDYMENHAVAVLKSDRPSLKREI